MVGFFTRTSAALACACCVYLLGLPQLFGKISHNHHQLIWFAAILAVSRCGDAISLDRVIAKWRGRTVGRGWLQRPARGYALPLRFVWLLIGIIYFFPGLAKLMAGPDWFLSDNLKYVMYDHWMYKQFMPAFRIDRFPYLCRAAAFGTILFEISFVFLILFRRSRPLAVAGGLLFHFSTRIFLRISFTELVWCYVAFVDWYAIGDRLRRYWRRDDAFALLPPDEVLNRPDDKRSARRDSSGVAIVGSTLLVVNIICGFADIDTWPVSVYPQFEQIRREPVRQSLEFTVTRADGSVEQVQPRLRTTILRRIVELEDERERDARLSALMEMMEGDGLKLSAGDSLRVDEVTRSTRPDDWERPPRKRTLLLEFHAGGQSTPDDANRLR
jgi:hypothetical protein